MVHPLGPCNRACLCTVDCTGQESVSATALQHAAVRRNEDERTIAKTAMSSQNFSLQDSPSNKKCTGICPIPVFELTLEWNTGMKTLENLPSDSGVCETFRHWETILV